jgi:glycosyltransferase involved in cell wall biosynthesis
MYLSAVVITKNAAKTLQTCLKSLGKVADELIIIDSGSDDDTIAIANDFKCIVIKTEWLGYGETKNLGHQNALFPYIISLDADEELSEGLIEEILAIKNSLENVYSFKRLNNFCGTWIKYGAWYPDVKIRIYPKTIMWNSAHSHEELIIPKNIEVNRLSYPLLHYAYQNLNQLKVKTNLYANLGALEKQNKSLISLFIKLMFSPFFGFLSSYIFKLGFLDGYNGLLISYYKAKGTLFKYYVALTLKLK